MSVPTKSTEDRARMTGGSSSEPVYRHVTEILKAHRANGMLLDIGCGQGNLHRFVGRLITRYIGADVVRYAGFPAEAEFHAIDLDSGRIPLDDGSVDIVVSIETIEHLENPRALAREMSRLCKPGGLVLLTTPNQLSFLSKLTLVLKNHFTAFADGCYPAHLSALLEIDLRRIAQECGWTEVEIVYFGRDRIPGTAWSWPGIFRRLLPRAFSECVCLVGCNRRAAFRNQKV